MGSRTVPYDPEAVCDLCGAKGANDFMGDLICGACSARLLEPQEDLHQPLNKHGHWIECGCDICTTG